MGNIGKETRDVARMFYQSKEGERSRKVVAQTAQRARLSYEQEVTIEAQAKEIERLKAQVGEGGTKWETLKALIRELLGLGGSNDSNQ